MFMNKKFKKILSAVLAVVMVLCAVPVMTYAADSDDYCSYKVGDIIEFGSYPQSYVSDEEELKSLYDLEDDWANADWFIPSDRYIWNGQKYSGMYVDVTFENQKYRAVTIDDGATVHFFKFEPIKWRVLDPTTGLLMSEYSLDFQPFTDDVYYNAEYTHAYVDPERTELVSYENSDIRKWLNNYFDKIAFTKNEYNTIVDKVIDETRCDKSYIPTSDELLNQDYGFINRRGADPTRVAYPTKYAYFIASPNGYFINTVSLYSSCINTAYRWMVNEIINLRSYLCCGTDGKIPSYYNVGYEGAVHIRPFIQIGQLKKNTKHLADDWVIIKEPTYTENGKQCKYCKYCDKLLESKVIPRLKTGLRNIALPYFELEIQYKNSATLKPTVDCEQDYRLSYSSSDEEVLTVDENGKITTHSRGTATVTCTATDEDGKTLTDTCEVTVKYNFWQWIVRIFLFIIGVNSRI